MSFKYKTVLSLLLIINILSIVVLADEVSDLPDFNTVNVELEYEDPVFDVMNKFVLGNKIEMYNNTIQEESFE
ncbi:MAG: hypothetical protein ACLFMO_01715 [Eubacteriales bacterium]